MWFCPYLTMVFEKSSSLLFFPCSYSSKIKKEYLMQSSLESMRRYRSSCDDWRYVFPRILTSEMDRIIGEKRGAKFGFEDIRTEAQLTQILKLMNWTTAISGLELWSDRRTRCNPLDHKIEWSNWYFQWVGYWTCLGHQQNWKFETNFGEMKFPAAVYTSEEADVSPLESFKGYFHSWHWQRDVFIFFRPHRHCTRILSPTTN